MSVSPELATQTDAPQATQAPAAATTAERGAGSQKGYAGASAALSPREHDCPGHAHGVEPAPGDTVPANVATARVEGAVIDAAIRTRLMTELNRSTRMAALLVDINAHGGTFDIKWSARGNYHRSGHIYLDRNATIQRWIPSMMHELNHLNDGRQGRRPNVNSETRAAFVATKMRNEIHAHAAGYVGLLQQRDATGAAATLGPAGFDDFVVHLRAKETAEGASLGVDAVQTLAEAWLEDKYKNHWKTSNSGENYYQYWGSYWDEVHAP